MVRPRLVRDSNITQANPSILRLFFAAALALTVGGCGSATLHSDESLEPPENTENESPPTYEHTDVVHRLDPTVVPASYRLELRVDPAVETFSGTVTITIELAAETSEVVLHADESMTVGGTIDDARVAITRLDQHRIALRPEEALAGGIHRVDLTFDAPLPESMMGLYRVQEGDDWYAFTQFEPISARAAFPCFDEPAFKTSFDVTIVAPDGLTAAANGPWVAAEPAEAGWTRHRFAATKPIPTYLAAFAVGPFDIAEAPKGAIEGVDFRILTTKGKADSVAYPLRQTPKILAALSEYFDEPYPYAKLDFVAVPNFRAGAMENPGLVTYRESLLMVSADDPPASRRRSQSVIGHELAHMWFGNLVSPAWWDELWLNESFATWMGTKILEVVEPELEPQIGLTSWAGWVMSQDALDNARAIRQPIKVEGDIHNAFDGITYGKGAAVLRMLEKWVGPETFRDGVRDYMKTNAWGAATTADLTTAIEAKSKSPFAAVLATFIDQPGVPLVELDWTCDPKSPALSLTATQSRYAPAGSTIDTAKRWQIPVCVRYGSNEATAESCFLLSETTQTETIESIDACPEVVYPNADAMGYYRWKIDNDDLVELLDSHRAALTVPEKVSLVTALGALVEAGQIEVEVVLSGYESLSKETHRNVVGGVLGGIGRLDSDLIADESRPAFEAWVRKLTMPHVERLTTSGIEGEPVNDRLLRPGVIASASQIGREPALIAEARAVATRWIADRESVPLDLAGPAVALASEEGDEALWTSLRTILDDPALSPLHRRTVLGGLGSFRDPQLHEKSLALTLDGTLRAQDFFSIVWRGLGETAGAERTWTWMTTHYPEIRALLGDEGSSGLARIGSAFCTSEDRDRVQAFFDQPEHQVDGSARTLAQTLEGIDRCTRLRAATADGIRAFFAR